MSHIRVKTKYIVEGAWGSREEKALYVHHNLSSDYVTAYDDDGKIIFSSLDEKGGLLDAIKKTCYQPFEDQYDNILRDGVEYMNEEDQKKCNIW